MIKLTPILHNLEQGIFHRRQYFGAGLFQFFQIRFAVGDNQELNGSREQNMYELPILENYFFTEESKLAI